MVYRIARRIGAARKTRSRDSCLREIKRFWQAFACGAHGNEISIAGRLLVGQREWVFGSTFTSRRARF
eukprot:COSAG02_NODE_792_length_17157_cov_6.602122_1_plen_67_part_10